MKKGNEVVPKTIIYGFNNNDEVHGISVDDDGKILVSGGGSSDSSVQIKNKISELINPATEESLLNIKTNTDKIPTNPATEQTLISIKDNTDKIPSSPATSSKQDFILAELEKKANLTETQPVQLSDIDLLSRMLLRTLRQLNVDSSGRLRVAAESVASHAVTLASLATLTNITNWGLLSTASRTQVDTNMVYQQGFRRNLVVS